MTVRILLLEDNNTEVTDRKRAESALRALGREMLEQIKTDGRLRHIPVIVVTSSEAEEDIARSYRVNANAYVTKPIDPVLFLKAVNAIGQFWLEIVRLP